MKSLFMGLSTAVMIDYSVYRAFTTIVILPAFWVALEVGWGFGGYVEGAFEGYACSGYGAFVEEATY